MKGFIGKVAYLLVCCVIGSAIVPVFEHFSPATTEAQAADDTHCYSNRLKLGSEVIHENSPFG